MDLAFAYAFRDFAMQHALVSDTISQKVTAEFSIDCAKLIPDLQKLILVIGSIGVERRPERVLKLALFIGKIIERRVQFLLVA